MLFAEVARTWRAVSATSSRTAKTQIVGQALLASGDDVEVVVPWLCGELRQRRSGVGWASIRDTPPAADVASLTAHDVDQAFEHAAALSGPGSVTARGQLMRDLFARATHDEQALLRGLIFGELRQGAQVSVVIDALARATSIDLSKVRRAVMLRGAVAPVAAALLKDGEAALARFTLEVGRPILPMLASTAPSVTDALAEFGEAAVEAKLDGIRAQVHRDGDDVAVFSRSLDDITARVPEIVAVVKQMPATRVILDGEAISLDRSGRPVPFQETGARAATNANRAARAMTMFAFDILHLDGDDLIDRPLRERSALLAAAAPALIIPRIQTADATTAETFAATTLDSGHEGVVVKALDASYEAGRRGASWQKVKPVRTIDLVVLAAEWGHGRRVGLLSNLHLGARDRDGGFVMVGKTFKGMTDAMLRWQTERLKELELSSDKWTVHVTPSLVVEIGFDGVQRSTRYPGGVALRFARVLRYRVDKSAADADTIESLQALLP